MNGGAAVAVILPAQGLAARRGVVPVRAWGRTVPSPRADRRGPGSGPRRLSVVRHERAAALRLRAPSQLVRRVLLLLDLDAVLQVETQNSVGVLGSMPRRAS